MTSLLSGLALVAILAPLGVWAVRFVKRQRGIAVLATSMLLVFGMNMQITPPPPPQIEMIQRQAEDDESRD